MKTLIIVVALLGLSRMASAQDATAPTPALQDVSMLLGYVPQTWTKWQITSRLSLGVSKDVGDFYTVGARDYFNGQWLSGWGKELFPFIYDYNEAAYISVQNLFNANEGGKGAIGAAFGFRPVNLINDVARAAGALGDIIVLPPFLRQVNNFTSIEAGWNYRFQNVPGVSREERTIGGQVRIPFNLLKGL